MMCEAVANELDSIQFVLWFIFAAIVVRIND